ncbi:MAG: AbrB/MazE/SpoVT family DNA-binding domain-containing protein [Ginsengibacter sp.]|jgi:antitoxin component of MazEF toxin-antitoxin module
MQSTLKKIGNSFGVIINKKLLSEAGINTSAEITIEAERNAIIITPRAKRKPLNRDLRTWRKQIKAAIKEGQKPGKSVWGNKISAEEDKEWTW